MSKPTVLFVDDEPNILNGLRRATRPKREEWTLVFANGGQEALDYFAANDVDVLVADMRMPGIDGATLIARVAESSPGTIRLILSGESDVKQTFRTIGKSHRYLTKPQDPVALVGMIEQLLARREEAGEEMRREAESFFDRLVVRNGTFSALRDELAKPDCTTRSVAEIVSQDANLSARVLQIVNSGYFGKPKETYSVCRGIETLGLDRVRDLLDADQFGQGGDIPADASTTFDSAQCPQDVAALARKTVAERDGSAGQQEMAYAMGLFCSLGHMGPDGELQHECNCSAAKSAVFGCSLLGMPTQLTDNLRRLAELRPEQVSRENCAMAISQTVLDGQKQPRKLEKANG